MKRATSIVTSVATSFVILGGVFAATEVRYVPRIVMVEYALNDRQRYLHTTATLIQFQIDVLEERRTRLVKNGGDRTRIQKINRRITRLEKQQEDIERELMNLNKTKL